MSEIQEALKAVYEFNMMGGNLHVAIDDGNMRNGDLDFCEESIRKNDVWNAPPEQLEAERRCLALLRAMSEEEREMAYAIYHGHIQDPPA